MRAGVISLLVVAGLMAFPIGASAAKCSGASKVPTASTLKRAAKATLCLVNRERRKRGIPGLRSSRRLAKAAAKHSRDMVKRGYFDHVSPGGKDPGYRISAAGYRASAWGENIAWGSGDLATPKSIVRAWMKSEGHRENILRRVFRDSGMGLAIGAPANVGGTPAATYSQDFGRAAG
jgi:uncharacterized protein YkwD